MISERPTNHLFRGSINNGSQEPEPAVHPNVGDIAIPNNVWPARLKAAFHKITKPGVNGQFVVYAGGQVKVLAVGRLVVV